MAAAALARAMRLDPEPALRELARASFQVRMVAETARGPRGTPGRERPGAGEDPGPGGLDPTPA